MSLNKVTVIFVNYKNVKIMYAVVNNNSNKKLFYQINALPIEVFLAIINVPIEPNLNFIFISSIASKQDLLNILCIYIVEQLKCYHKSLLNKVFL